MVLTCWISPGVQILETIVRNVSFFSANLCNHSAKTIGKSTKKISSKSVNTYLCSDFSELIHRFLLWSLEKLHSFVSNHYPIFSLVGLHIPLSHRYMSRQWNHFLVCSWRSRVQHQITNKTLRYRPFRHNLQGGEVYPEVSIGSAKPGFQNDKRIGGIPHNHYTYHFFIIPYIRCTKT